MNFRYNETLVGLLVGGRRGSSGKGKWVDSRNKGLVGRIKDFRVYFEDGRFK